MSTKAKLIGLILLMAALAVGCRGATAARSLSPVAETPASAETPTANPVPVEFALKRATAAAKAGRVERNITYCTNGSVALTLDVYYPQQMGAQPAPVVLYVHGGGWTSGSKESGEVLPFARLLIPRGYLFVTIDYRLAPKFIFPAQIEDVKCAVRYLRAHSDEYYLDPDRIGAWGSSAGGHLVSLLGLAGPTAGFDVGNYLDESSGVRSVVDMFGPTDLTVDDPDPARRAAAAPVFRTAENAKRGSPVQYVKPGGPPFLILQGTEDQVVPPAQSQELYDKLRGVGADVTLVLVKNAGHGFVEAGGAIEPSLPELMQQILQFFDRTLGS